MLQIDSATLTNTENSANCCFKSHCERKSSETLKRMKSGKHLTSEPWTDVLAPHRSFKKTGNSFPDSHLGLAFLAYR